MTGISIVTPFSALRRWFQGYRCPKRPALHRLWQHHAALPAWIADSAPACRTLEMLGPLHWERFPERDLQRNYGQITVPYAAFAAACLVGLNEGFAALSSMGVLRRYLIEHPGFIWLLGFPLVPLATARCGFDAADSVPTARHFTRLLRTLPNAALQFLLGESVAAILAELSALHVSGVGECISLDTKHILAWVKENNPKAYVTPRFDKQKQPAGDPDCKLGCKRRHNQRKGTPVAAPTATPRRNPVAASSLVVGEYYWGYGSGVVVVKVPDWGEFVLAELTQTFDRSDVSYFFPLMTQTEQRLGFRPRWGTFDAAFDAFYVYAYFYREDDPDAFAAVPFSEKGGYKVTQRQFSPEGAPLCAAKLPMTLKFTYTDRTVTLIEHERAKYVCPLCCPKPGAEQRCPINHRNWTRGGCTVIMPTSIGARLRYTQDRESPAYKAVYRQRTATERINSQAFALGIERPHLRNGKAIANLNTLIYTLINLRFLLRLRQRRAAED